MLRVSLDCVVPGLLDFWILGFEGLVVELPCLSELVELFAISRLADLGFIVSFEFGDAFVFGHEFLEVAATLGGCSGLQKLRDEFEYFAESKVWQKLLPLVFGGENALIVVHKQRILEILLLTPFSLWPFPLIHIQLRFLFLGNLGFQLYLLRLSSFEGHIDGTVAPRHSLIF